MIPKQQQIIVVMGATGRQGRSVVRHLIQQGWPVRAVSRTPQSVQARALATLGAEVVHGDMGNPASLRPIFAGAYGIYSVQTPYLAGPAAEVRQGIQVAEVAYETGVQHLVYGSAGIGIPGTGIPSWESKVQIEAHIQALGVPLTILRPMAFMELMTDPTFFPAVSTWQVMPKLMGGARQVGWLCTDDLGAIVAKVFAAPDRLVGQVLSLASDSQSINACRLIYQAVMGKQPRRFPIPSWLFAHLGFVGQDLAAMWRWLHAASIEINPAATRDSSRRIDGRRLVAPAATVTSAAALVGGPCTSDRVFKQIRRTPH